MPPRATTRSPNAPPRPRAAPRVRASARAAAAAPAPGGARGDGAVGSVEVPEDVVNRLSPVVLRTFSEEDFHRVDMRSIARDAGMSFATIYRHFHDKEALLFWFIAHWLRELYPAALATLETDESALVRVQNYLVAHLRFYARRPEVGRVIFMTVPLQRWMRDDTYRSQGPARRLLEVIAEGQASGEIRADVSKVAVFDLWSGVFNRAFLMWEYRGRSYPLIGQADALCRILLTGIAGPAAMRRGRVVAERRYAVDPGADPGADPRADPGAAGGA